MKANARQVQQVVLLVLGLNLAVALAKAVYGYVSGSLAVSSDAIHSGLDAASNVIGLVALRIASTPPDEGHPYGHSKVEVVAALLIGVLIASGSVRFAYSAIDALMHGIPAPQIGAEGFVTIGATLAVNTFVATYEARRGRALRSPFLVADAAHTASDVFVTIAVLASMVLSRLGWAWADPAAALLVIVAVARVAWSIVSANLGVLVDRAVVDPEQVKAIVLAVPGVVGCHRVRSRGPGAAVQLDLHLLVEGAASLRRAHAISHSAEDALRAAFPDLADVTIHLEPAGDPEEPL